MKHATIQTSWVHERARGVGVDRFAASALRPRGSGSCRLGRRPFWWTQELNGAPGSGFKMHRSGPVATGVVGSPELVVELREVREGAQRDGLAEVRASAGRCAFRSSR